MVCSQTNKSSFFSFVITVHFIIDVNSAEKQTKLSHNFITENIK